MPGLYPSQPESSDAEPDKELRARARQLADDIELAGARIRVRANNCEAVGVGYGAAFSRLADQLGYLVKSLRRKADTQYPGPHPRPFQYYTGLLHDHVGALRDAHWTEDASTLAGFRDRLERLNTDWPDLDGEYFDLERAEPPLDEGAMLAEAMRRHWADRAEHPAS